MAGLLRYDGGAETTMNSQSRPRVVIAGAGFGGLQATKALANVDADVVVVDTYNHHCFQPLLYQVATAALSPADVAWPIRAILRNQKNARVIMAMVTAVDLVARCVHTSEIDLPYDYLVLATGATRQPDDSGRRQGAVRRSGTGKVRRFAEGRLTSSIRKAIFP